MFRLRMRTLLGGVAVPQSGIRCPTTAQHDKILKDFSNKTICQIKIYPLRFIFSSFLPTKKEELFTPPKNYFLCFFLFKKAFGCFFKLISYMYVLWTNFFAFSVFSCCFIAFSWMYRMAFPVGIIYLKLHKFSLRMFFKYFFKFFCRRMERKTNVLYKTLFFLFKYPVP